jgi:hypothetical protein
MALRDARWPGAPYLHEPGRCPCCGDRLCPVAEEVRAGGSWSTGDQRGQVVTGGHLFCCQCPKCGVALLSFPRDWPRWQEVDPSQVRWYPQEPA